MGAVRGAWSGRGGGRRAGAQLNRVRAQHQDLHQVKPAARGGGACQDGRGGHHVAYLSTPQPRRPNPKRQRRRALECRLEGRLKGARLHHRPCVPRVQDAAAQSGGGECTRVLHSLPRVVTRRVQLLLQQPLQYPESPGTEHGRALEPRDGVRSHGAAVRRGARPHRGLDRRSGPRRSRPRRHLGYRNARRSLEPKPALGRGGGR
mmetsp:Transcript_15004/g.34652  ORF Transcript_15004/g.34652 Transcript_15004/m.34652 type:complete len:205 (+) Transcript_15004:593-1207(+)